MARVSRRGRWSNWAGTVEATPQHVVRPTDVEQIQETVRTTASRGGTVRVAGSGHSFTALAACDDLLVLPQGLPDDLELDASTGVVTVSGGTGLRLLSTELLARGRALAILGDIDAQTVVGATQTGTHGTARDVPATISASVVGLEMVLADGSLVHADATLQPDLFAAARVGLGALGVVTRVSLATVPAFRLTAQDRAGRLEPVLDDLDAFIEGSDHPELYWFPGTDWVQLKTRDRTEAMAPGPWRRSLARGTRDVVENGGLALLGAAQRAAPRSRSASNALAARLSGSRPRVDDAHLAFTARRRVRFVEMEYAMPRSTTTALLRELKQLAQRHEVGFPVEVRFGPGDDLWLSPSYGRDSVYVSVHSFRRVDHEPWFADCEALFVAYEGRPHWAKLHSRKASDLATDLPQWEAFRAVRDRVDPDRVFSTAYLRGLLGD